MGSARLPGKVLMNLGSRPTLAHVLTRASRAEGIDEVCLATSDLPADDPVAAAAKSLGFSVFRGSESDVLSRYVGAAAQTSADIVVRITCDCPLIDPEVIASAVRELKEKNADYVCNILKPDWPHGLDCEAFPRAALDRATANTQEPYDREHVTPWIRRNATAALHLPGPGGIPAQQRWVLDYPEDYEYLSRLFALFPEGEPPFSWQAVWQVASRYDELSEINAHLRRKPA